MRGAADHIQIGELLSPSECSDIVALFDDMRFKANDRLFDVVASQYIRDTEIAWLRQDQDNESLFNRIRSAIDECNKENFGFDVWLDKFDSMQFAEYSFGQKYLWHKDYGQGEISGRKLSICIQLSEDESYTGGELQIFRSEDNIAAASRRIGDAIIFPSHVTHRVTPIRSGLRYSLVAWINGPPFR